MNTIKCPYCGNEIDWRERNLDIKDEEANNILCGRCGQIFQAVTHISISFDVCKCDCLNTGKHDWRLTNTAPRAFSLMRCSVCGEERDLTLEERERYNVPSREEYFNELKRQNSVKV